MIGMNNQYSNILDSTKIKMVQCSKENVMIYSQVLFWLVWCSPKFLFLVVIKNQVNCVWHNCSLIFKCQLECVIEYSESHRIPPIFNNWFKISGQQIVNCLSYHLITNNYLHCYFMSLQGHIWDNRIHHADKC